MTTQRFNRHGFLRQVCSWGIAAIAATALSTSAAQRPGQDATAAQREAMHKLAFLVGHWSGPVTVTMTQGEPRRLTQTEEVEFKLDGLVLLIEGMSTDAAGKAEFAALATVAYDDEARAFRIRAYNSGHYVDAELKVLPDGFSWGFTAGPVQVTNTMHLTAKGEWQESTDVSFNGNPPHRSVELLLTKD